MRHLILAPSLALLVAACSDSPSASDLNRNRPPASSGGNGGTENPSGGSLGSSGGSAGQSTGGTFAEGGSAGSTSTGGTGGDEPTAGTGGSSDGDGGTGATGGTGGGDGGTGGQVETGPYAPRSGKFKMLVYSKTAAFRHDASIATGKTMLTQIAADIGIDPPTITETNTWLANINDYELVFFMNPTGDIFNNQEQATFEAWMKQGGAFAGTHSATDTENGWDFYAEVTGQYYNGHGPAGTQGQIQFEADALNHPALVGLPNPWQRSEEWYLFNSYQSWSTKPGFKILGRKAADGQPIMWVREYDNYRSFYTAIGHDGAVFQDPQVKTHLTGGILWTVRREHCLATPRPAGCP